MRQQTSLVLFCLLSFITVVISGESFLVINQRHNRHRNLKLFVFGDSYADTGNWPKSYGGSWQEPYGSTFPGSPSGRFSDGRVLTDYIAGVLGTKSQITYGGCIWRDRCLKYICETTKQIDYFQQFVKQKHELLINSSTIAIMSLAGNDYATYFTSNHTLQELPGLTTLIIDQLVFNVKRIHELGVQKIAITGMEPLGCLQFTASTYQNCSDTENSVAKYHNQVLVESIRQLNNQTGDLCHLRSLQSFLIRSRPTTESFCWYKFKKLRTSYR